MDKLLETYNQDRIIEIEKTEKIENLNRSIINKACESAIKNLPTAKKRKSKRNAFPGGFYKIF